MLKEGKTFQSTIREADDPKAEETGYIGI